MNTNEMWNELFQKNTMVDYIITELQRRLHDMSVEELIITLDKIKGNTDSHMVGEPNSSDDHLVDEPNSSDDHLVDEPNSSDDQIRLNKRRKRFGSCIKHDDYVCGQCTHGSGYFRRKYYYSPVSLLKITESEDTLNVICIPSYYESTGMNKTQFTKWIQETLPTSHHVYDLEFTLVPDFNEEGGDVMVIFKYSIDAQRSLGFIHEQYPKLHAFLYDKHLPTFDELDEEIDEYMMRGVD
jgi:hypothetical protein